MDYPKSKPTISTATLYVVATPLDETSVLPEATAQVFASVEVLVGESRKAAFAFLKNVPGAREKESYFVDPPRAETLDEITEAFRRLQRTGGSAAIFSDTGMPILFDPGKEVLEIARTVGLQIRSVPGATSWGTACALSGFPAPFWIEGFLPRDADDRKQRLGWLAQLPAQICLMDTPYRFLPLLDQTQETLGKERPAFLAWELATTAERLLWGSLSTIAAEARRHGLEKGEFVLLVSGQSSSSTGVAPAKITKPPRPSFKRRLR